MTPKERAKEVLYALAANPEVFFELSKLLRHYPGVLGRWDRPFGREWWIRVDTGGETLAKVYPLRGVFPRNVYRATVRTVMVENSSGDLDFLTEGEAMDAADRELVRRGWVLV